MRTLSKTYIIIFFAVTLLLPLITIQPGLPQFSLSYLFLAAYMLWLISTLGSTTPAIKFSTKELFYISLAFTSITFSLFSQVLTAGHITLNDLFIYALIITYFTVYKFSTTFFTKADPTHFLNSIMYIFGLAALIGLFQKFNFLEINLWLTPYYVGYEGSQSAHSLYALIDGAPYGRIPGIHGDPRHFANLMIIGICVILSLILAGSAKNTAIRMIRVMLLILCLFSIYYTNSFTGLISITIILSLTVFLFKAKAYPALTLKISFPFVGLTLLAITIFYEFSTLNRLLDNQYFMESLKGRVDDLVFPLLFLMDNPHFLLFGIGPNKDTLLGSSHNGYTFIFLRYGLAGLFLMILILYQMLIKGLFLIRSNHGTQTTVVGILAVLICINWSVFLLAESLLNNIKVMFVNLLLYGLVSAHYYNLIKNNYGPGRSIVRANKTFLLRNKLFS